MVSRGSARLVSATGSRNAVVLWSGSNGSASLGEEDSYAGAAEPDASVPQGERAVKATNLSERS